MEIGNTDYFFLLSWTWWYPLINFIICFETKTLHSFYQDHSCVISYIQSLCLTSLSIYPSIPIHPGYYQEKIMCGRNPIIKRMAVFWGLKKTPVWRQNGNVPGKGPFSGGLQSSVPLDLTLVLGIPLSSWNGLWAKAFFCQYLTSQGPLMSKHIFLVMTDIREGSCWSGFGTTKSTVMTLVTSPLSWNWYMVWRVCA